MIRFPRKAQGGMSFFKADRRNRLSLRISFRGRRCTIWKGGGSLELSTITAGQAKWTARWQTRIPGQRTIEAWTRLHIVLSGPAGRNSFGPPAARSKLDAGASPSALNSSRVRASRPPLESGGLMASRQHSSRRCRDRCRTCYPLIYQPRDITHVFTAPDKGLYPQLPSPT